MFCAGLDGVWWVCGRLMCWIVGIVQHANLLKLNPKLEQVIVCDGGTAEGGVVVTELLAWR